MHISPSPKILSQIIERSRKDLSLRKKKHSKSDVEQRAKRQGRVRPFMGALKRRKNFALIAEHKRASPSAGLIRPDMDVAQIVGDYEKGGACCLSVLTDTPFFNGSLADLMVARKASSLPILRKDYMIDPWQVAESRAHGADAILVILAAVKDGLAAELMSEAARWKMDVLVEVHDQDELDRALALDAQMIGINNRNLSNFVTALSISESLAPRVPKNKLVVAESGIYKHDDLVHLHKYGARAFLVGESLMRAAQPRLAVKSLLGK